MAKKLKNTMAAQNVLGRHLISFYAMQSLDFGDYLNLAENVLWKSLHCNA